MNTLIPKNRIHSLFRDKPGKILSVYFTAGFPAVDSTVPIIGALAKSGVDMIEIGIPFSDPMADGPVIQESSRSALKNGMNLKLLFSQLKEIRKSVDIPLLLMGYLNPVMQYGLENFCTDCETTGIDGVILPDLPLEIYQEDYRELFELHGLSNVFLITPQTANERIFKIDALGNGFVYMVSSSSTTGIKSGFSTEQLAYFERIKKLKLRQPCLIGFGISGNQGFEMASRYAHGAIVGSAFVKILAETLDIEAGIMQFVKEMRGSHN
jgi:tryptophan synthase alpha chain